MRALQSSLTPSLKTVASALQSYLHRAVSAALQQPAAHQELGRRIICTAATTLGHPYLTTHHCWIIGTLGLPARKDSQVIQHRNSLSIHSQPVPRPAAGMASGMDRQASDMQHPASTVEHDECPGERRLSLWQQLKLAGSRGVKRKLKESSNTGQHKGEFPGAAQRRTPRRKQSPGSAPLREAQGGRKGVSDLGQGAQVHYSPGMFTGAEAAHLLRALQVTKALHLLPCAVKGGRVLAICEWHCELHGMPQRPDSEKGLVQEEVAWQQKEVTVHGKTVMQPRLVAYMGDDPSLAYTYSRQTMSPKPWTPAVLLVKVVHMSPISTL